MQVQKTNNVSFTNGLYFSKASNVCFNKTAEFVNKSGMKVSKDGYKYIEQVLPKNVQSMFEKNPFIKGLAEKFDTFIWFSKIPKNSVIDGSSNIALAKVMWADTTKDKAQTKMFFGISHESIKDAQNKLFDNIG